MSKLNRAEYFFSALLITVPTLFTIGEKGLFILMAIVVMSIGAVSRAYFVLTQSDEKEHKRSWVSTEDFDQLKNDLISEIPTQKDVIEQIIDPLMLYSKNNVFKKYLGFNFIIGEEGQGKKEVLFELFNHCKSEVNTKVFYGALCNENNVKSYFEDIFYFIDNALNPVVIFVDIEKLPQLAMEVLTDCLQRGVIEHSKDGTIKLKDTLFFGLVDVIDEDYQLADNNLERLLQNKQIPNSLISKNSSVSSIKTHGLDQRAEQTIHEINKLWKSHGINVKEVAPELIVYLLKKAADSGNSSSDYIKNTILKKHSKYALKVKEKGGLEVVLGIDESMKLQIKVTKIQKKDKA